MSNIIKLTKSNIDDVMTLFCKCFKLDHYYKELLNKDIIQDAELKQLFQNCISFCLNQNYSIGIYNDKNELIAFLILFDYTKTFNEYYNDFCEIFYTNSIDNIPYKKQIHDKVFKLLGNTLYILSIAVDENYRLNGIASSLIDYMINNYKNYNFVGDISNPLSISMYKKENLK